MPDNNPYTDPNDPSAWAMYGAGLASVDPYSPYSELEEDPDVVMAPAPPASMDGAPPPVASESGRGWLDTVGDSFRGLANFQSAVHSDEAQNMAGVPLRDLNDRAGVGGNAVSELASSAAGVPTDPGEPPPGAVSMAPDGSFLDASGNAMAKPTGAPVADATGIKWVSNGQPGSGGQPSPGGPPVYQNVKGEWLDASGNVVTPELDVKPPAMLQWAPGGGGRMIPAQEVQAGRSVAVEAGVPIPEEAWEQYRAADTMNIQGANLHAEAAQEAAKIGRAKEIGVAQAEADAIAAQQQLSARQQREYTDYRDQYEAMEIDPGRVWAKKSTLQKIMSIIGVALSQLGASRTGGPNIALSILNQEIDRDIDAQKANREAARTGLSALGKQHEQEDMDLDLERAKRLKAVEMMASRMLGSGVDQANVEAARNEILGPIMKARGDLLDEAAKRAAGKRMEEIKYKTESAKYVGGRSRRPLNHDVVYRAMLEDARQQLKGKDEEGARKLALAALRDQGVSKEDAAMAATVVHTGQSKPYVEPTVRNPLSAAVQDERNKNFIPIDGTSGLLVGNLRSPLQMDAMNKTAAYANMLGVLDRIEELSKETTFNRAGAIAGTEDRVRMRSLKEELLNLTNDVWKRDVLSNPEAERLGDNVIGNVGGAINWEGQARLNELRRSVNRRKDHYMRAIGGLPAERRVVDGMPFVVITAESVPSASPDAMTGGNTKR